MNFFEKLKIVVDFISLLPPSEIDRGNIAKGTLRLIAGESVEDIGEGDAYLCAALYTIADILYENIEEIKLALKKYNGEN